MSSDRPTRDAEEDKARPSEGRKQPSPRSLAGAGFEFASVTAGLALLGWWLDGKWGTAYWLTTIGCFIGIIGGTYKIWRTGKRFFD